MCPRRRGDWERAQGERRDSDREVPCNDRARGSGIGRAKAAKVREKGQVKDKIISYR